MIRKIIGIIGLLLLFQTASALDNKLTTFPGGLSKLPSPNGKYILHNVDSEDGKTSAILGNNHALYLQDLKTGKKKRIYPYGRHVEVLWSPEGNRLIINDAGGSDFTNCIIMLLNDGKESINIMGQLRQKIKEESIFGNHHVYIQGIDWINEDKIEIKIYGYGDVDPNGFTLWYEYTIGDGFKFIKRLPTD